MIQANSKAFLATKKHNVPMAIDARNAPIGARKVSPGRPNDFLCLFVANLTFQ